MAASIAVAAGFLAQPGPSSAAVTAVSGSAFGYHMNFENPQQQDTGPTPTVTLPPGGAAIPVTATAQTGSAPPPFRSGPITVSTQGTPSSGSVTSSATLSNVAGEFDAASVASTCTANEAGVSGKTTITGGTVDTDSGDTTHPAATQAVPTEPPVNHIVNGHLHVEGIGQENFQYIFNEQEVTANSITVNAVHLKLLGPVIKGDLIIGQSVCAITATAATTTTTTQGTGGTTTTTQGTGGTTTTTQGTGGTTTTTQGTGATTSTTQGTGGTTTSTIFNTVPPAPGPVFGSINVSDLIRQIVCPILRQLAADPFLRPFIEPFLIGFGCTA